MAWDGAGRDRLTTWKEIAAFIGRDERTVKRWETTRGLPVRRVPGGRSTVFAERRDLEDWLASSPPAAEPLAVAAGPSPAARAPRWVVTAAVASLAGVVGVAIALSRPADGASPRPPARYSRAVYLMNTRTRAGLEQAIGEFERLTLEAPGFAPAYAGLATSFDLTPEFGRTPPVQAFAQAKVAAEHALSLDRRSAEAERALGFAEFWGLHDVPAARRAFTRAIQIAPDDATAHLWYANILTMQGDEAGALDHFDAAERLDPTATATRVDHANALIAFGRMHEAGELLRAIVAAQPDNVRARLVLAYGQDQDGDHRAALDTAEQAAALAGDGEGVAIARAGRDGLARGEQGMASAIRQLREADYARDGRAPYELAVSLAPVDPGRALDLLEALCRAGEPAIMGIRADRRLLPLHREPRFRTLLTRLGLPPLSG